MSRCEDVDAQRPGYAGLRGQKAIEASKWNANGYLASIVYCRTRWLPLRPRTRTELRGETVFMSRQVLSPMCPLKLQGHSG